MTGVLSPAAARRIFLVLTATRWFPVGLVVAVMTLWVLERGLTISQALTAFALQGIVVFLLELPTSGFADAFGRKPLLVAAATVNIVGSTVMILADTFWGFVLAAALQGVFRALDSGPLEAWYVDTVHATRPGADVDGTLAAQGTVLGAAMGLGAVISGGLIAWNPLDLDNALRLPMVCWAVLNIGHLLAVTTLMKEPRDGGRTAGRQRAAESVREAPGVIRDGLALLRGNVVLRSLVLVEVFWTAALVIFETVNPIRLAELLGGAEPAAAVMGPVAAAGWGVFAAGSTLAGLASRRFGVARTAIAARVLNGLGVVAMGLVLGPVALVVAYLFTYGLHGAAGPVHQTLVHREASARNRTTVLSIGSMVFFVSYSALAPPLGLLAEATSTQTAMVLAGAFSVLGAALYLPALRAERVRGQEEPDSSAVSSAS